MPIESGRYIITHVQYCNLASLSDANDGTSLLGCLEQDVPGEEWNIKELRNGRYSIANFGHKMSASAEFHSKKGDHVVGRETDWLWLITEHDAGKYTISTANGKLRWFLEDDWPKTPITLNDAPPSDPRCHWNFQKIGRVNTTPYEAAKEEAEKAKATVFRTLEELEKARREAEKAKEEAEEHKETFRSYFDMMFQLNIGNYTIANVLDNEQPRPSQASLFWAAEMGHDGAVQLILAQEGINVNLKTTNGRTPLHFASHNGHEVVVELLLAQEGVDVNSKDTDSVTPLYLAAEQGHAAVVRLLLARDGVDADSKYKTGATPLLIASENGRSVIVRLLLARDDVDVNVTDETGKTPLMWAEENKHKIIARRLREKIRRMGNATPM